VLRVHWSAHRVNVGSPSTNTGSGAPPEWRMGECKCGHIHLPEETKESVCTNGEGHPWLELQAQLVTFVGVKERQREQGVKNEGGGLGEGGDWEDMKMHDGREGVEHAADGVPRCLGENGKALTPGVVPENTPASELAPQGAH
jgi:hypothetical protein